MSSNAPTSAAEHDSSVKTELADDKSQTAVDTNDQAGVVKHARKDEQVPEDAQLAAKHSAEADRRTKVLDEWPGWVEMISNPVHFNTLLKDIGIKSLHVRELHSLDIEHIIGLPRPVYALIFLFRWDKSGQPVKPNEPAEDVWFARQTADNACGTYALLNVVNNLPDLELGPELAQFKQQTSNLSPKERGDALRSFSYVRSIHNSFASEGELRDADMLLQGSIAAANKNAAAEARKAKAAAKKPVKKAVSLQAAPSRTSGRLQGRATSTSSASCKDNKRKACEDGSDSGGASPAKKSKVQGTASRKQPARRQTKREVSPSEAPHHYCAYVPINGQLWKLDGLEPMPEMAAKLDSDNPEDWLLKATDLIKAFIEKYEREVIDFSMMAVVHDPLFASMNSLSENIKSIQRIEKKLSAVVEDWEEAVDDADKPANISNGIDIEHGISQSDIDDAESPRSLDEKLQHVDDLATLLEMRKTIADRQPAAKALIKEELARIKAEEIEGYYDRHDYDEFFDQWLEKLADAQALDALMADAPEL